jgi:hypothetical protein
MNRINAKKPRVQPRIIPSYSCVKPPDSELLIAGALGISVEEPPRPNITTAIRVDPGYIIICVKVT